ncbi:DNA repair protein RecN [Candidatus Sulfidibacterium hydrothermale]|uniref:DNA repair protein RecN n=1 Tax=Candidatus Sulfidibacterium hydrothermale TaxID=2875962 RepID=UPI001F0A3D72|nr:DNA repair protein RecN [Candidatus Sulfidibacterium hydrothermale]UBM62989.1 DNA repair protein RecN [Candidatus Sulfidibacterium hydrothermale]
MLQKLSITNYTLISRAEIDFDAGFTVITGETGAGKSILLGALSLILGRRADPSVLMDKTKKCVVEGTFFIGNLNLSTFFDENDLDYDEQTLLRREINPAGKSRAFINDTPVNLNVLRALGERLVDIHSQHQTLLLNEQDFQRALFDAYIQKPGLKETYSRLFKQYRETEKKVFQLQKQNEQAKRDEDYYRFQLNELDAAALDADEMTRLEEKNKLLRHAVDLRSASELAAELLKNGDVSVLEMLGRLKETFSRLSDLHPSIAEFTERLSSSYIELADLALEIESFASLNEFDPDELQQNEERLNMLYSLMQKHHVNDVEGLLALAEEYREKLENITGLENELEKEKKKLVEITHQLEKAADALRQAREKAIPSFEKEVIRLLQQLGMKDAQFQVKLIPLSSFSAYGKEQVHFYFSANKGKEPDLLSKTASGGELSRLMLAVKSLIHQEGVLPTIVFDEIDAGVSGDIAGKLGMILKKMATHIQVLAITHLPQIAARADFHFRVFKNTENDKTVSQIVLLNAEERLEEIAKMLSDEKVTDASRAAARELLAASR